MPDSAAEVPHSRDRALDLLKWLALLSMLIDHLRHVWPQLYPVYIPGRLAFPFFCLAIAANLARPALARSASVHSAIPLRYLALLLGFALLSEWPYRLLVPAPQSLNVLPTLALGLLIAAGLQHPHGQRRWLALAALSLALLGHPWLMFGAAGALLPAAFLHALRYHRCGAGPTCSTPALSAAGRDRRVAALTVVSSAVRERFAGPRFPRIAPRLSRATADKRLRIPRWFR